MEPDKTLAAVRVLMGPGLTQTVWSSRALGRGCPIFPLPCKLVPIFPQNAKKAPRSTTACGSLPATHFPSQAGKYELPKNRDEESQREAYGRWDWIPGYRVFRQRFSCVISSSSLQSIALPMPRGSALAAGLMPGRQPRMPAL